jgi:hypothetical protein
MDEFDENLEQDKGSHRRARIGCETAGGAEAVASCSADINHNKVI